MTKQDAEKEYNLIKTDVNAHGWAMSSKTMQKKYKRLKKLARMLGVMGRPNWENHTWFDDLMRTDISGCSTTGVGEEQYEYYTGSDGTEKIQYDYRHIDGQLFSCITTSLEKARMKRNNWLTRPR